MKINLTKWVYILAKPKLISVAVLTMAISGIVAGVLLARLAFTLGGLDCFHFFVFISVDFFGCVAFASVIKTLYRNEFQNKTGRDKSKTYKSKFIPPKSP